MEGCSSFPSIKISLDDDDFGGVIPVGRFWLIKETFIKGFLRIIVQMKTLEIISKASIYNFEARMSAGLTVGCDDDQF